MKGQLSFFIKIVALVLTSILFLLSVFQFFTFRKAVIKEKEEMKFKNDVINTLQKLVTDKNCLAAELVNAYQKNVIDKQKLDKFIQDYKNLEPDCMKALGFDYRIKVVQFYRNFTTTPGATEFRGAAWVPNSDTGNSVSLVLADGREIRRHWTVPADVSKGDPSRTAVDSKGNVWVGNRGRNTLVKIALNFSDCIDKNGNGIIETSIDKNNNGRVEDDEMLSFESDECIVKNIVLGWNVRAVCIGKKDVVYAGSWNENKFFEISPDGEVKKVWDMLRPYGCVVDRNGIVWIVSNGLVKLNPKTGDIKRFSFQPYALWRYEDEDSIVISGSPYVVKLDISEEPPKELWKRSLGWTRGIFVSKEGDVYTVGTRANVVYKFDRNGNLLKTLPTCQTPTGIDMDAEGNLWILCMDTGIKIITPELSEVNSFTLNTAHYAYTDFTGYLTGSALIAWPQEEKIAEIESREWFFGVENFSPEKAKIKELQFSLPISIKYNDTFASEGVIYIYAVRGELEEIYSLLDDTCKKVESGATISFSKDFHFSYPVKYDGKNLCMLETCKKFECSYKLDFEKVEEGDYILKFRVDEATRTIVVRK